MKRLMCVLTLIAASTMAMAQRPGSSGSGTTTPNSGGPRPQLPSSDQSVNRIANDQALEKGHEQEQPQQQPAAQPTGKHQPVAKSTEEFNAYKEAASKPDAPSAEAAADEFAKKYPESELRAALYQHAMSLYQNANNSDKTIEMGHKTLAIDPDSAPALVTIATFLANRTRETDLDRDERLTEAKKDAEKAIELASSGQAVPAGTPPEQAAMFKDTMISMAYAALGSIDFNQKNYPAAEQNLRKSVEPSKAEPDPISYYQLALTLQREGKAADALDTVNKCIPVAKDSPQVAAACKNLQGYLQRIVSNPPAKPAAPAAAPATPPASPTPQSK